MAHNLIILTTIFPYLDWICQWTTSFWPLGKGPYSNVVMCIFGKTNLVLQTVFSVELWYILSFEEEKGAKNKLIGYARWATLNQDTDVIGCTSILTNATRKKVGKNKKKTETLYDGNSQLPYPFEEKKVNKCWLPLVMG